MRRTFGVIAVTHSISPKATMSMPTLNLGILAHVDAGKTTLTERLLYETGATRHLGRVDHGDTTTDSDSIERRRGITIRTAVATMTLPVPARAGEGEPHRHPGPLRLRGRGRARAGGARRRRARRLGGRGRPGPDPGADPDPASGSACPSWSSPTRLDRAGASLERTLDALREELPGTVVPLAGRVGAGVGRGGARRGGAVGRPAAARVRRRGAAARRAARPSPPWPSRPGSGTSTRCCPARRWPASAIADVLAAITTYLPTRRGRCQPSRCTRRSSRSTGTPTATGSPTSASTRAGSRPATT